MQDILPSVSETIVYESCTHSGFRVSEFLKGSSGSIEVQHVLVQGLPESHHLARVFCRETLSAEQGRLRDGYGIQTWSI